MCWMKGQRHGPASTGACQGNLADPLPHLSVLPIRARLGCGGRCLGPDQDSRAGLCEPIQEPRQLRWLEVLPLGILHLQCSSGRLHLQGSRSLSAYDWSAPGFGSVRCFARSLTWCELAQSDPANARMLYIQQDRPVQSSNNLS